jgi:hypothetical protein
MNTNVIATSSIALVVLSALVSRENEQDQSAIWYVLQDYSLVQYLRAHDANVSLTAATQTVMAHTNALYTQPVVQPSPAQPSPVLKEEEEVFRCQSPAEPAGAPACQQPLVQPKLEPAGEPVCQQPLVQPKLEPAGEPVCQQPVVPKPQPKGSSALIKRRMVHPKPEGVWKPAEASSMYFLFFFLLSLLLYSVTGPHIKKFKYNY